MSSEEKVAALLNEARELRESLPSGSLADTPADIHAQLLKARAVLDRMEQILAHIIVMKNVSAQQSRAAKAEYEDAWGEVATHAAVGFSHENAAPRERYAKYDQSTVKQQVAAREAENYDSRVWMTLDIVKMWHRSIDGLRQDLNTRLRIVSLNTSLER